MKKITVPLIIVLGFTLCWAASKFSYDLTQQAAQYSAWNIPAQEYMLTLDSNTALAAMDIPGIDSIRLLSIRCLTLDANGNPYTFRFSFMGDSAGFTTSAFLAINMADSDGVELDAGEICIGNEISTNPDIELSVYAAGQK